MSTVNGPTLQPDPQAEQDELARESRPQRGGVTSRWNSLSRPAQWGILLPVVILAYAAPALNLPIISTETGNGGGTNWDITLFQMSYYALIAVGLNVVVGYAGLLDLGYVAFFAVGSYVAAMFTSPDSPFFKIPYLWTLPLAMAVTMFFGVILGVPTLRLRGDYLAIVTLGFGEIIRLLATIIPAVKGQVGFQNVGHPPGEITGPNGLPQPLFSNSNGAPWYWLTLTIVIVVLLLVGNLERSRVGRAWVAIREDEDAAEIMGVPVFKFKVWAFAIGAAVGGLTGALAGGQVGFVNNQSFTVQQSILFLAAVVLGGAGNKVGAIIGGALVAYIPARFTVIAPYKYLIFGGALVVLMIFRSGGILAARQKLLAFSRRAYAFLREPAGTASDRQRSAAKPDAATRDGVER